MVADKFKSSVQFQQFPMPGQSQPSHQSDPNIIEGEIVDRHVDQD